MLFATILCRTHYLLNLLIILNVIPRILYFVYERTVDWLLYSLFGIVLQNSNHIDCCIVGLALEEGTRFLLGLADVCAVIEQLD